MYEQPGAPEQPLATPSEMLKRPATSNDLLRSRDICVNGRICSTALVALVALVGCPLDERTMQPVPTTTDSGGSGGSGGSDGGSAGASDGGAGGSTSSSGGGGGTGPDTATSSGGSDAGGSSSVGGTGNGAGGATGTAGPTTTGEGGAAGDPGCPDLDDNNVADCDETLVENASFDANLNGWHEETNALANWERDDALDHDASGSATITNRTVYEDREGQVMRGLWQCIPSSAGTAYRMLTQVRITGAEGQGWGGLNLWFYDGADCTGTVVTASTPLLGTTTGWSLTEAQVQASETAQSMLVRLVVNKPFSSPAITVDFDNVLIRED